jgi:hypothetical protein
MYSKDSNIKNLMPQYFIILRVTLLHYIKEARLSNACAYILNSVINSQMAMVQHFKINIQKTHSIRKSARNYILMRGISVSEYSFFFFKSS